MIFESDNVKMGDMERFKRSQEGSYRASHAIGEDRDVDVIGSHHSVAADIALFYKKKGGKSYWRKSLYGTVYDNLHGKSDNATDGVYKNLTLQQIENTINCFSAANKERKDEEVDKFANLALLKGVYKGGTSTENAVRSSFLLPWDIDVKDKPKLDKDGKVVVKNGKEQGRENIALVYDMELNEKVFQFMKSISVLAFRSSSGVGMAGFLVVPAVDTQDVIDHPSIHLTIGKIVNDYINEHLDVPNGYVIEFDQAQNKFRQARMVPPQAEYIQINPDYLQFNVDLRTDEELIGDGDYVWSNHESLLTCSKPAKKALEYKGSLPTEKSRYTQINEYNDTVKCADLLVGHYEVVSDNGSQIRYNRLGGDSKSLIVYTESNTFYDNKQDLKGTKPFNLYTQLQFDGDFFKALESITPDVVEEESDRSELEELYRDFLSFDKFNDTADTSDEDKVYLSKMSDTEYERYLREVLDRQGQFFVHLGIWTDEQREQELNWLMNGCGKLENLAPWEKKNIVKNYINGKAVQYDVELLRQDTTITSKVELNENEYLSADWVLKNLKKKINLLDAGCGVGKTYAFLSADNCIAKRKQVLYVLPRTLLVHQQALSFDGDFKMFACSSGTCEPPSTNIEFFNKLNKNIVHLFDEDLINADMVSQLESLDKSTELGSDFKRALKSGILTYDQFSYMKSSILTLFDIVAFDESHIISKDIDFRFSKIDAAVGNVVRLAKEQNKTKVCFITATAGMETSVLHATYKDNFHILSVDKKYESYPKVHFVNVEGKKHERLIFRQMMMSVAMNRKVIMLINSRKEIKKTWAKFEKYCKEMNFPTPKMASIGSKDRSQQVYSDIVDRGSMGSVEILFTTSMMEAGVNLEMDCGVDFIFDYTRELYHVDAKGALQMVYRNRNRNSRVFAFGKAFDSEEKITLNGGKRKLAKRQNVSDFMSDDKYGQKVQELRSDKTIVLRDLEVSSRKIPNTTTLQIDVVTSHFEEYEKDIASFLRLAHIQGMKVRFDLNDSFIAAKAADVSTNKLVIQMLSDLMSIGSDLDVVLRPVEDDEFNSSTIGEDFKMKSYEIKDDRIYVTAHYHATQQVIINAVRYYFNYLRGFYFSDMRKVFNFILNNGSGRKQFVDILGDYIRTHKELTQRQEVCRMVIESVEIGKDADPIAGITAIRKKMKAIFERSLKEVKESDGSEMARLYDLKSGDKVADYVYREVERVTGNIFVKHKNYQDGSYWYSRKYIVDSSWLGSSDNDDLMQILLKKLWDKENEGVQAVETDVIGYHKVSSERTQFANDYGVAIAVGKDFFDMGADTMDKDLITEEYVLERYADEIKMFVDAKENKRSKNCFVLIGLDNESIIIKKSRKILFEYVIENDLVKEFISYDKVDFSKFANFYRRLNKCENRVVLQINDVRDKFR